jgi:uncharacterized protein (TIGR01777 family)
MANKVVLAGGSGFLGRALARRLGREGWEVVILTRDVESWEWSDDAAPAVRAVGWNGETGGAWAAELEGAAAVVNFAGRSVNCVHTLDHSREILESRLAAVRALGKGYARAKNPPPLWVQCSASGYYGNAGDRFCEESLPPGPGFLAEVCRRWEEAVTQLDLPEVRRVIVRIGTVLDAEHGALPPLVKITKRFLGGAAGTGRQYLSWIHRDDLVAGLHLALTQPAMSGAYNLCAPGPVTNKEFMREMRAVLGRPWVPAAPEFMVRLIATRVLDTEPNLALHGQRCSPARIQAAGLTFAHPALHGALIDLLKKRAS